MDRLTHIFNLRRNSKRRLTSPEIRSAILDVYDYTCQYCFNETANRVDHIIPMRPEKNDLEKIANMSIWLPEETLDCFDNFTAACHPCNSKKTNKIISEPKISALQEEAKKRKALIIASLDGLLPRSKPAAEYLSSKQIKQLLLTRELLYVIKGSPQSISMHPFKFSLCNFLENRVVGLIEQGADIYALGHIGLYWAGNYRKIDILNEFKARNINMEVYPDIFILAVYRGYPEIAGMFSGFSSKNKSRLNKLYIIAIEKEEKCHSNFNNEYLQILEILSSKGAKPAAERTLKEDISAYLENNFSEMLAIISDSNTENRVYKVSNFPKKHPDRLALCFSTLLKKDNLSHDDIRVAHTLLNRGADMSMILSEYMDKLMDKSIKIVADNKSPDRAHLAAMISKKHIDIVYLNRCLKLIFEQDGFFHEDLTIVRKLIEKGGYITSDSFQAINQIIGKPSNSLENPYIIGGLLDVGWKAFENEQWFTGFDLPDLV